MKNIIYLIILAIFSIFINQYTANRGVFPIDSFLIFDSAYNIVNGYHPFKDYWLITGPFVYILIEKNLQNKIRFSFNKKR